MVAWLIDNGHSDVARSLLDEICPWLTKLRFYPVPLQRPRPCSGQVHMQDVRQTIADIDRIKPSRRILAQKEAVEIWAPFYDGVVAFSWKRSSTTGLAARIRTDGRNVPWRCSASMRN